MQDNINIIRTPRSTANDDQLSVVVLHVEQGTKVTKGYHLLDVEGSKAVVEITAPCDGYFYSLYNVGDFVPVGQDLAILAHDAGFDIDEYRADAHGDKEVKTIAAKTGTSGAMISQKASALIDRHGLDVSAFSDMAFVTEDVVKSYLSDKNKGREGCSSVNKFVHLKPVRKGNNGRLVIAGAGLGVYQLLSVFFNEDGTNVIAILDDDEQKHGQDRCGVPIVGKVSSVLDMAKKGEVDSIICAAPKPYSFRKKVYELAQEAKIKLANAIHSSAVFDDGVLIGGGNYIGPFCYVGSQTRIGDNCFFSSRTNIEHHNIIGDGVTTGPMVSTSGVVNVGNNVAFGTGVFVENLLSIGAGSVIASGACITRDVPENTLVKTRHSQIETALR